MHCRPVVTVDVEAWALRTASFGETGSVECLWEDEESVLIANAAQVARFVDLFIRLNPLHYS